VERYRTGGDHKLEPGLWLGRSRSFWNKRIAGKDLKISLNVSNLLDKEYYDRRRFPPSTVSLWDERRIS
jgi:outer membrane receptor protein involved in Fe transport